MYKIAVIFPGQGSQYVGMGKDFYENYSVAKNIYLQADNILTDSLSNVIFNGPDEELRLTINTQPAILTTSIAIWNVLKDELGIKVDYVAGHSLGEYSALVAAESIKFEDAVGLVRQRGKLMEEAVPGGEGTMAAIMGIEQKKLEDICEEISKTGHIVDIANINSPNQIVIAGTIKGVEFANQMAKENGAKRVIPLTVSGPFHSRLMQSAQEKLTPMVENTKIQKANIPVIMNVTAKPEFEVNQIKGNLINQVASPVRWAESIEYLIENGVDTLIEIGPGKVLTGLVKKINRNVRTYTIEDINSLTQFKEEQLVFKGGK